MIFWIAVAMLAAAVTYAVTRPMAEEAGALSDASAADLAVYKDQLTEIDADAARGTINATEAEAARAEVARRLLRRPAGGKATPALASNAFLKPVYLATTLALPSVSLALYMTFGVPGLPGVPLRERIAAPVDGTKPEDLIAKVEARLRDHPDDGKGWDVIGPVYMARGQFVDAAAAYASAIKLLGETPARLQGFANARIRAENGLVPDDARKALRSLLAADPKRKEPRIWLALAKEQDGNVIGAAADYRALIAEAPEDAPWKDALQERLSRLDGGPPLQAGAPSAPTTGKGPTAESMAAVEAMSPADREAFIGRMVGGLAEKLKTNSKDKDGWLKLMRAYQMLGRKDDATKALADARAGLAGDAAALRDIDDAAKQLGIGG